MSTTGALGVESGRAVLRIVVAAVGVCVVLASCGTGGSPTPAATTPVSSAGAPPSEELAGCVLSLTYDNGEGFRCVCPGGSNGMHSCEKRSVIYGTASFVTGTFGLVCASVVVKALAGPG